MKKFAIISCVLMLIINCCTQKKEKAEIVVEKYYDEAYICHVQKQNIPTSIYFSFSYRGKTLYVLVSCQEMNLNIGQKKKSL